MILFSKSNFEHKKIKDCGVVITGSTPSKNNAAYWNGSIPFITPAQLGNSIPITKSDNYVTTEGAEQGRLLDENTVLVCCIGSLGKVGVAGLKLITNQQINAIKFDVSKVDHRYGYFICNQLTPLLEHYAPSTTVKIIKKSTFENIKIPLPPLSEQKRIASILDAADELRKQRKQNIAKLDKLLQATFLDMFGDPVVNEKGWEVARLDEVVITNPRLDKNKLPALYDSVSFVPMASVSDKEKRVTKYEVKELSEVIKGFTYFEKDDVIVAKITPCFENKKIAILNDMPSLIGFGSTEFHVFRNNHEKLSSIYLFYLLSQDYFFHVGAKKMRGAAGQRRVPLGFFEKFKTPLPPLSLQTEFASIVEKVETQKAVQQAHLAELDTLFACLQQKAFAGEL